MASLAAWRLPFPFAPVEGSMFPRDTGASGLRIRAVRPDDKERIVAAFRALDPQSVYQRFFFPKRAMSDREVRWVTEPREERNVVLVATTGSDEHEAVVALAQFVQGDASVDIAFVVAESHRGRGIASRLLRQLTNIARERGVTQFEADVLPENGAMLQVFRRSGLPTSEKVEDGLVHVTLSLCGSGRAGAPGHRIRCLVPQKASRHGGWLDYRTPRGGKMRRALAAIAILAALAPTAGAAEAEALAMTKQCFSCHALDTDRQAPSFKLLASNYRRIPNADYILERRVRLGGLGHWGAEPMPPADPRPAVSEEEARELVAWILALR